MARPAVIRNGLSFRNRRAQIVMAIYGFAIAGVMLLATAGVAGIGSKVSTGVIAFAGLGLGIRALQSGVLKVEPGRLSIRSLVRTRSISYSDLASAEVITRPVGMYRRVCVRLRFGNGSNLDVTTVNEAPSLPQVVDEMATLINERIHLA
jgi:hypothetical protein